MTIIEIPQIESKPMQNPQPLKPGERMIGDFPNPREVTASKKVDDLSHHESKHSLDPKKDPKHNAREKGPDWIKPGTSQPSSGKTAPGLSKS